MHYGPLRRDNGVLVLGVCLGRDSPAREETLDEGVN